MKGPAVRRWQEMLVALGEKIDIDGAFGPITNEATKRVQSQLKVKIDGIVGQKTLDVAGRLVEERNKPTTPTISSSDASGIEIVDCRGKYPWPKNGRYMRAWDQITGIVLHRTACILGGSPDRWAPVNAHLGITMEGKIILTHPWELMIWHGHGPSPWTIGVEFDGNPEGKKGYYWKPGGGPHPITDAQVKASEILLDMFMKEFSSHGSKIKYLLAHRQSSKDRECDPGLECWQKIAIPWMDKTGAIPGPREGTQPTAGLKLPVGWAGDTWGDGKQIPTEWDSRSTEPFWKF